MCKCEGEGEGMGVTVKVTSSNAQMANGLQHALTRISFSYRQSIFICAAKVSQSVSQSVSNKSCLKLKEYIEMTKQTTKQTKTK